MTRLVLTGPQGGHPTAGAILAEGDSRGRTAMITAGWQEWEADDGELRLQLGPDAVNLNLYARAEAVWAADPDLRRAYRALQDDLRYQRRLYNRRLEHLAASWMELLGEDGPDGLLGPERDHALHAIQALDAYHLDRVRELTAAFDAEFAPLRHSAVLKEREAIAATLRDCDAVVIEGGHVALLRNRMRMFGLRELFDDHTVVACSGAAMVLGPRIVLFHDAPPSGAGHTEVALTGLGMYSGLVPLPHARTRLRLDDTERVARLAARFAPDRCVILEAGTRIEWDGSSWTPIRATALDTTGSIQEWRAVA